MGIVKKYCRDESGQFAIMFSVCSTALLMMIMMAVDIAKIASTKRKVAAVTDAAALAGAQAFDSPERALIVKKYLEANGYQMFPGKFIGEPVIQFDDTTGEVFVSVGTEVELPFARMLGQSFQEVDYKSVVAYPNSIDPLTIAFVLDVSGSMGWNTSDGQIKLDVLKVATKQLFAEIDSNVRNKTSIEKYLRTGMSAFSDVLAAEQAMSWGFLDVEGAVDGLIAGGTTNSAVALENAYKQIKDDRAFRQSVDPTFNLATLDEFVIFMTDGENTAGGAPEILDEDSYETCLTMRDDGVEVYAVAFTAPTKGQLLLIDCASWDNEEADKESKRNQNRGKRCGGDNARAENGRNNARNNNGGFNDVAEAALNKCRTDVVKEKKEHFFDAEDAQSFKEIFRLIGQKINEASIRIKS